MIQMFKIKNRIDDIESVNKMGYFLQTNPHELCTEQQRQCFYMLKPHQFKTEKNLFSNRCASLWNRLNPAIEEASTTDNFKNALDGDKNFNETLMSSTVDEHRSDPLML